MLPDLSRRADPEDPANPDEQMDALPGYAEYRRCLHDLDSVSRVVLAHRATLAFLDRALPLSTGAPPHAEPLRILEVACGDGSMLRRIARWAHRRNLPVALTGLDLNPRAIQVAHEFPNPGGIEYVVSDVFAWRPRAPVDVILSAHFTHHLAGEAIVRFLVWMERTARRAWFINDLHRHPNPYRLFRMLGSVAPWRPVIVSDGLISIRRAFTVADWQRLTASAGIFAAEIAPAFPARVTVARFKP